MLDTIRDTGRKYTPLFPRASFLIAMGAPSFRAAAFLGLVATYTEAMQAGPRSMRLRRFEAFVKAARMAGAKTILMADS